jgi:hypothetical protein
MNNSVPIELTNANIRNISFQVLADVYNNNTFSCDITSYIVSIDNIVSDLEFKEKGSILGKPSVNTASITLDNTNGKFSPNNENNIEKDYPTGKFRTNTPVKILAGFIDSNNEPQTRILFQGIITAFKNKITRDSKQMVLSLKDDAVKLQRMKVPNHSYKNGKYYEAVLFDATIDESISYLLDYAFGEDYPRTLHKMNERLPIVEFTVGNSIWQTLQLLAQSVEGRIFFEAGEFKFYSPLSSDWDQPLESQYTFNADNIQDFTEEVDFDNIKNRWKITSNPKTLQLRQVLVGTPSSNTVASTDEYWTGDTKNCLGTDNKTITLKSQDQSTLEWIDSLNVPLVYTQTYSDLIQLIPSPTQDQIDTMNNQSLIKVWDRINNVQLTINKIDVKRGKIELLEEIDPDNYNLQIIYQYYQDQIVHGKYREYIFDLEKIGTNIELPVIIANNIAQSITYSTTHPTNNLYLSDWTIFEGNKRVKFKLTNNVPIAGESNELDTVYITKFEVWGNALECTAPLTFEAIDGDTINQFENSYEITNDYISNIVWGKQICDYFLYRYKSNLTFLDVNTKGIPQIDLLDRVTIQEAVSGNNFDYIVIGIKHSIKKDGWKTNLQLESLIPPWAYDESRVNALFYKMGQSYLSLYSTILPTNPTGLEVEEQTFLQNSGELITRVLVTFVPPLDGYYAYSLIQTSDNNGVTWNDVGISTYGKYYIDNVKVGTTYKIRVVSVSKNGQKSNAVEKTITISGKDTLPGDVPKLTLVQDGSVIKVSITPVDEPDIRSYELRMGQTWENSTYVKHFYESNTTIEASQEGTLKFMVKAIDNSGNYSENATSKIIDIFGLPLVNQIYQQSEDLSLWTGTGVYQDLWGNWKIKNNEQLGQYGYFSNIFNNPTLTLYSSPEILLPTIDLGPNVLQENCYYIDDWGDLHLKTIETLNDYNYFSEIFNNPILNRVTPDYIIKTFLDVKTIYNQDVNNRINIEYRTRVDGDGWSDWKLSSERQFFGRRLDIKLLPKSLDEQTNVIISAATVQVDVPDVEDTIENISISIEEQPKHINYHQKFYEEPHSIALYTADNTGKQVFWRMTNITKEGFDLELLDKDDNIVAGKLLKAIIHGI